MKYIFTPFNMLFAALVVAYGVVIFALTHLYDAPAYFTTILYSAPLQWGTVFFILCFVTYRVGRIMIVDRPARLTQAILIDFHQFITRERIFTALPLLILLPVFFSLFTSAKNLIPLIVPFAWDHEFGQWDKMLHFGRQPWEWTHMLFGAAGVTMGISLFYKLWFVVKFFVMYWQAFSLKYPQWREQFFIALAGIWIINGTLLAIWLSSAGPCFYGLLYPDAPDLYAPLMEKLRAVQIYDLRAMDYLWTAYEGHQARAFSGISAMPSMHVSLACLFAILGWRYGGLIRWGLIAFLILTLLGSVHLGWHYAIDGYLSLLTTPLIWLGAGWIVRRWRATS